MPNDQVPATDTGLPTRRALLAALPALGLAPAAAAACEAIDPHTSWIAEARRLSDAYNAAGYDDDDPEEKRHLSAITDLERRVCETPAMTPAGAAAQLEFAIEEFCGERFGFGDELEGQALRNVLASIRRLA